jgi:hypothetical protein
VAAQKFWARTTFERSRTSCDSLAQGKTRPEKAQKERCREFGDLVKRLMPISFVLIATALKQVGEMSHVGISGKSETEKLTVV